MKLNSITRVVIIYTAAAAVGWEIGGAAPGWVKNEQMLVASARENSEIPPEEPASEPR